MTRPLGEETDDENDDLGVCQDLTTSEQSEEMLSNLNGLNLSVDALASPSSQLGLSTEIIINGQNFNRMKSALKINEIHNRILSCSYAIILATETSWDESVKSEEVFGNSYNVFRHDRDIHMSGKKSGGGEF